MNAWHNLYFVEIYRQQRVFQENPESYNGAIRDNYSWSQSITDVDIRVNVSFYDNRTELNRTYELH